MISEPEPSSLTPTSKAALAALKSVTSLAWPILKTQSEILGLAPERLLAGHLPQLVPKLADAVQRFSTPGKAEQLRSSLGMPSKAPQESMSGVRKATLSARNLGSFAQEVLERLERYSPLAWSLLEAQCSRFQVDATSLTPVDLGRLVPELERSLARFGNPIAAHRAAEELEFLARKRNEDAAGIAANPVKKNRLRSSPPSVR